MKVSELLAQIGGGDVEKTAAASASAPSAPAHQADDDSIAKLAEDLEAGGRIMADAFVDRTLERFKKEAAGLPSSHASAGGVTEPSNWSKVKEKLQKQHGSKKPDDSGHTRAEAVYKHVGATPAAPKN